MSVPRPSSSNQRKEITNLGKGFPCWRAVTSYETNIQTRQAWQDKTSVPSPRKIVARRRPTEKGWIVNKGHMKNNGSDMISHISEKTKIVIAISILM